NHYRYIGIGAGGSATDEFIAEFHRQSSTVRGWISPVAAAAGLQRISYCEHWFLGRMVGSTQRSVTLTWTNQSPCNTTYVTNVSTLRVVPYGNSGWGDDFGGTSGSPANPGTGTSTITYNTPGNYLFFTLGSTNPNDNPLPFTLLSFNGRNRTKDTELSFSVKGNDEQQHYLVERSTDGRNFTSLIKIAAIQNTSTADYTTLDEQPVNGWNYYRVTAVDNTNRSRQSQIIRVWFGNRAGNPSIYPNPVQGGNVQLFTGGMPKGMYNVQIMGVDGKIILSRTWQFDGVQPLYNLSVPQLPSGMYYLLLRGENQPPVQLKFVK
ncbi:MAG: T9SS type A sorting domain-containing protein, partial [Chitinophagaceae bacterium]